MDVAFCGWIFVVTFISKSLLVQSTIEINVGHFQMLGEHYQLRQCAEKVLQQNESVGGRISDQTGVCEGLSRTWARNQTIEKGYEYAKKIHAHTNFGHPVEVSKKSWSIPGILNTGAKVDVYLTQPKGDKWILYVGLTEVSTANLKDYDTYVIELNTVYMEATFIEQDKDKNKNPIYDNKIKLRPQQIGSAVRFKISFVAEGNSLQVLFDDELVETTSLSIIRVNYLREVYVLSGVLYEYDDVSTVVNGFAFTEAKFWKSA